VQSITLSVWDAAEKLGIDEQTMASLKRYIPHIIIGNECLFPRRYIEACVTFLTSQGLSAHPANILLFRDMDTNVQIIRETQRELHFAFLSYPTEPREKQELSAASIAEILGVAVPTVQRWWLQGALSDGAIPKVTVINSYRWAFS